MSITAAFIDVAQAMTTALGPEAVARTGAECLDRLRSRLEQPVTEPVHTFGGLYMDFEP